MFSKKWIHYTKYKEEMCGSSEKKRIYILFATLWKNVHSDVKNSCSRTECGVRKHFQKIPVFRGGFSFALSASRRGTLLQLRAKSLLHI